MNCQRCRLPLLPHNSLDAISQNQAAAFAKDESESAVQSTVLGALGSEDASFILLTESIAGPNPIKQNVGHQHLMHVKTMSHEAEMLERLFDYINANTDVDLPLCGDCAETVRSGLKIIYEEACAERDSYVSALNKIRDEPVPGAQEIQALEFQVRQLEKENARALRDLKSAEKERANAQEDLENVSIEESRRAGIDRAAFRERNQHELEFSKLETEKHRLEAISDYQTMQLHRLQRTNVYNDVFCIGHDGHFGTINGLRLGRLKDRKVEWSEINAAWGQTLLLLATFINKLGIQIPEYRLRLLGSLSKIEKLELDSVTGEPTGHVASLELYSSGDYSFGLLLNHKRLDGAMVAFLEILRRVGKFVEDADPTLKLPYAIEKDKIGGNSIRLSMNASNETWTAACKFVLTNCKWILAFVVSH